MDLKEIDTKALWMLSRVCLRQFEMLNVFENQFKEWVNGVLTDKEYTSGMIVAIQCYRKEVNELLDEIYAARDKLDAAKIKE